MPAESKMVKIGDQIINNISDNNQQISYLPQESYLPSHLKVSAIISMMCEPTYANIIKSHSLVKPHLHKKSKELSGGEIRVLEILLTVYANSKFSLLDEPFNGVAPVYKDEIKEIIQKQSETKGFIVTDHDYRNVLDITTKIILMYDGGTKVMEDADELTKWGYLSG